VLPSLTLLPNGVLSQTRFTLHGGAGLFYAGYGQNYGQSGIFGLAVKNVKSP